MTTATQEVTEEDVRNEIKSKFGSISIFCEIIDEKYNKVYNTLRVADPAKLQELMQIVRYTKRVRGSYELSDELLAKIKQAIREQYSSQFEFCVLYGFDQTWLSNLISGRRKRISKQVKHVCKLLNVIIY